MADAYGSDEGFTAYHEARNRDVSSIDTDDIAAARLVASEWLDGRYLASFPGLRVDPTQTRQWPRQGAVDIYGYAIPSTDVPVQVENATYEAALRELQKPGILNPDFAPNKYKRVSIDGAIAVDYVVFDSASDIAVQFPVIGQWLYPLLVSRALAQSSLSGMTVRV